MKRPRTERLTVSAEGDGERLDRWLSQKMPELSRSALQRLIREGRVRLDGKTETKCGAKLHGGQIVELDLPKPEPAAPRPEPIALDVVYEDEQLIVVNKPAGMVVHPAAGNRENTLVNALLHHCRDLSGIGGVERPGIVHRLDKQTSGLLVAAKNDAAHRELSRQLADRTMKRSYVAVVWGEPQPPCGTIAAPIGRHPRDRKRMAVVPLGGRDATTHYRTVVSAAGLAVLELTLETGRTHQIRVHLRHIGHPVLGDEQYGLRGGKLADRLGALPSLLREVASAAARQMLHAFRLRFVHPTTGRALEFKVPLPGDLAPLVEAVEKESARR